MYIKHIGYLLLLCLMSTAYAESATVVGRIEDFDGNPKPYSVEIKDGFSKIVPAAYTLIRGQKKVDVGFLTELQANDLLLVNDDQHFLQIKLADNSLVKVTAAQSPYTVPAKGEIPSIFDNFRTWAVGLTERHQEFQETPVSTKGGSGNQSPFMPLLEKTPKVLVAGNRALYLIWQKGKPEFKIALQQGANTLFERTVKNRELQLPELLFTPGEYQVTIDDGEKRSVSYVFTVVEKLLDYPKELSAQQLASLSPAAQQTVRATWLAEQDNGRWLFEVYQQISQISQDNHFAKVLRDTLGNGVTLKP